MNFLITALTGLGYLLVGAFGIGLAVIIIGSAIDTVRNNEEEN